jgi:hypothetical protein
MEIKSTMIRNRSTQGGNHSTTGSNESIRHSGDQEEHFTGSRVAAGNPGKMAIKPEIDYAYKGAKGDTGGTCKFDGSDAARECMDKDPNYSKAGAAR